MAIRNVTTEMTNAGSDATGLRLRIVWFLDKQVDTSTSMVSRLQMARALASFGHSVRLVARGRSSGQVNDVAIAYLPRVQVPGLGRLLALLAAALLMVRIALLRSADVILLDRYGMAWAALPASCLAWLRLTSVRFVLDVRSPPLELVGWRARFDGLAFRLALCWAGRVFSGITTITPALRLLVSRYARCPETHIGVWSSAVSTKLFAPADAAPANGKLTIMYHGTLSPNRGVAETILAMNRVRQSCPDLRLLILGSGSSLADLKALVAEQGLTDRVQFHAPVPHTEVPRFIAACAAGVIPLPDYPGWQVSSPLKLMEYLAAGKPVLASRIEAHYRVLGDAPCVIYLPTTEPEGIAEAFEKLYGQRQRLAELGASGPSLIHQQGLTWEAQGRRLEAYLLSHMDWSCRLV